MTQLTITFEVTVNLQATQWLFRGENLDFTVFVGVAQIRQNHLRKLKDESDFKFSHSSSMAFGGKDGKSISGSQTETNSYQKQ